MYYDRNKTVSYNEVASKHSGKFYWMCEAGYTDSSEGEDSGTVHVYDFHVYESEAERENDQDGRYALERVMVRGNTFPNHISTDFFTGDFSGTIK
jgi:hypothetical protein